MLLQRRLKGLVIDRLIVCTTNASLWLGQWVNDAYATVVCQSRRTFHVMMQIVTCTILLWPYSVPSGHPIGILHDVTSCTLKHALGQVTFAILTRLPLRASKMLRDDSDEALVWRAAD